MNEQQLAVVKQAIEILKSCNPENEPLYEQVCAYELAVSKSITGLQSIISQDDLDKKAENARELGLSYDDEPKIGCVNHDCDKCKAAQPAVPLTDDTRRLDALAENSWDLRCFDMSDDDIGWRVIEHHMAKPHERTVAEVFRDDPRQAIDAAIEAAQGITKKGQQ